MTPAQFIALLAYATFCLLTTLAFFRLRAAWRARARGAGILPAIPTIPDLDLSAPSYPSDQSDDQSDDHSALPQCPRCGLALPDPVPEQTFCWPCYDVLCRQVSAQRRVYLFSRNHHHTHTGHTLSSF